MLQSFVENIKSRQLFKKSDKLLVAVSGGADSTVLAHLLKSAGYSFCLAHCNFKLRGKHSDGDERFCRKLADQLGVDIQVKSFDAAAYAGQQHISIQMAARDLRYDWFTGLLAAGGYHYLLTAHHAGDAAETLLLNLVRGTGINGLKGIPEKNHQVVRPMLPFQKKQILAFAKKQNITYRSDQSNLDDKYKRNFIRLHLIPLFNELDPAFESTMLKNIGRFKEESEIVNTYLRQRAKSLVTKNAGTMLMDKKNLAAEPHLASVLHYLLGPFGFNETQLFNIQRIITTRAIPGRNFKTATHRLTISSSHLVVTANQVDQHHDVTITSMNTLKKAGVVTVTQPAVYKVPAQHELLIEAERLQFPLVIRKRQRGDRFKPFGMKGFKLVSDFLKDLKLNTFERENCRLLVNGNNEIIWIMGYRSDERYRVSPLSRDLLTISYGG